MASEVQEPGVGCGQAGEPGPITWAPWILAARQVPGFACVPLVLVRVRRAEGCCPWVVSSHWGFRGGVVAVGSGAYLGSDSAEAPQPPHCGETAERG